MDGARTLSWAVFIRADLKRSYLVYSLIAQLVEQVTVNHLVVGSSPAQGAKLGGVAEWLNAPVLKTGIRESVSRVRIPPPPPGIKGD